MSLLSGFKKCVFAVLPMVFVASMLLPSPLSLQAFLAVQLLSVYSVAAFFVGMPMRMGDDGLSSIPVCLALLTGSLTGALGFCVLGLQLAPSIALVDTGAAATLVAAFVYGRVIAFVPQGWADEDGDFQSTYSDIGVIPMVQGSAFLSGAAIRVRSSRFAGALPYHLGAFVLAVFLLQLLLVLESRVMTRRGRWRNEPKSRCSTMCFVDVLCGPWLEKWRLRSSDETNKKLFLCA